jgi:von Willebrand factor type A domain
VKRPTTRRALRRLATIATALGLLAALAPAASADIPGAVVSGSGVPIYGVYVKAVDATGASAGTDTTDPAGQYSLRVFPSSPPVFPLTVTYTYDDPCAPYATADLTATQAAGADGTALPTIGLAALAFCPASSSSFGSTAAPPSAYVDSAGSRVLSPAGGVGYLRLPIPYGATSVTVLFNGSAIGGSTTTGYNAAFTAPATGGSGALTASYVYDGAPYSRALGTLVVIGQITAPPASSAGVDIEVIVDISGSMNSTDPQFLRKDAMRALLGLVSKSDRLGAVGFDDKFEPVFDLQSVTDANSGSLAQLAGLHIINRGGTDYNVAFAKGYEALTLPAAYDAERPKYVIFLTDGGHNAGDFNNGHLLMSANPTGRPWPVCAVQLGKQFQADDVARLKRIAIETGGEYATARTNTALSDVFRRCLGAATNQRTIVDTSVTFKALGKAKTITKTLGARISVAKFFVSFTPGGKLIPVLIDPKGLKHTPGSPGKNVVFRRSGTFYLFKVLRPKQGKWSVVMTPRLLVSGALAARVSVTVPRK